MQPLAIDEHVSSIVQAVQEHGAAVIVAPPGSGKTTRVPPALVEDGPVVLLQPRRVAARAIARRIAVERGWKLGDEIGWQVRFERRFGPRTRLLVATEGVLTARLARDPLLEEFRTAILDEFHERSLHADLALALLRQARTARDDLRVVVMSATLDARPISAFLDDCPIVEVRTRRHPVQIDYTPGVDLADAVRGALERESGHVLCFLPGAGEIERGARELRRRLRPAEDLDVLPLHGSLDADAQEAALAPSVRRKLILATNIAETSLTIDGVVSVVDSGLHKVLRRNTALGIDRLETERISQDSADQRAGRAGRTSPGRAVRLWDARDELRPQRQPEIERVDLAGPLLEVLAWGGDPRTFEWFEPPDETAVGLGLELLKRLGAVADCRITRLGHAMRRLPLHPRLARVLLASGGAAQAAAACAAMAEGWTRHEFAESSNSDLLVLADLLQTAPSRVRRAAEQLTRTARRVLENEQAEGLTLTGRDDEQMLLRAVLAGYPDRAARRREPGSARLLLASGHGAVLARESSVRDGEFLVAPELRAGSRGAGAEALVRLASRIDPDWLEATHTRVDHQLDERTGTIRAVERTFHHRLILVEKPVPPDPDTAAGLLATAIERRGLSESNRALLRRLRFADVEVDVTALLQQACQGKSAWFEFDLLAALPFDLRDAVARLAPESIRLPSGRRSRLEYRDDGSVHAAAKLQELFGLTDTPRVGTRGEKVTLSLLAPNGRPVQTTRDLRSFWKTAYAEVRKELRGRYPKHPWPEDPWTAKPTARVKRGRSS